VDGRTQAGLWKSGKFVNADSSGNPDQN
jgi:hypothetical protein